MNTEQTSQAPLAVSIPTAAEQLGISRAYGYKLANNGDLPTIWLGRRRLVPVAALTRLLDA